MTDVTRSADNQAVRLVVGFAYVLPAAVEELLPIGTLPGLNTRKEMTQNTTSERKVHGVILQYNTLMLVVINCSFIPHKMCIAGIYVHANPG